MALLNGPTLLAIGKSCACVRARARVRVRACARACVCACVHVCMRVCVRARMRMCAHRCCAHHERCTLQRGMQRVTQPGRRTPQHDLTPQSRAGQRVLHPEHGGGALLLPLSLPASYSVLFATTLLTPLSTSAPGLGSPCHICTGIETGRSAATSAPGLLPRYIGELVTIDPDSLKNTACGADDTAPTLALPLWPSLLRCAVDGPGSRGPTRVQWQVR